jgi:signal transduction histidine kinase
LEPVITLPVKSQKAELPARSRLALLQFLWQDPVLLGAFLFVGLMAGYQVVVHLIQPPWLDEVNDWLLAVLAWPELLGVVLLSWWLSRTHRPGTVAWWLLSAALLCYAIAQTLWLFGDQVFLPDHVPCPWWSDIFFLLQAPFVYLALMFLPSAARTSLRGLARLRMFLDSLLLMGAVTLLFWSFLFMPLYLQGGQSPISKATNLAYGIVDLGALFILIVIFTYSRYLYVERMVLGLLILAVILVIVGDFWFAALNQAGRHASNDPPDLFWVLAYMLVPLAGLAQYRLTRCTSIRSVEKRAASPLLWQDILDCLRFFLPFMVALLVSIVLMIRAISVPTAETNPVLSWAVSLGLLALVVLRQGLVYLENARLRRAGQEAQAHELAACEATRQMEMFLGIVSHELKTPLTTLTLYHQLAARRLRSFQCQDPPVDVPKLLAQLGEQHLAAQVQLARVNQLVNDLLDVSCIQEGRLTFRLAPLDLAACVQAVVEEQRQIVPERNICLHLAVEGAVSVSADAARIEQVIMNYLSNALKYSPEDGRVEVGVQVEDQHGRVWVRDQGPGLPPIEHKRIWERFHRAPGIEVQSGSGIGLGLGLHISKTIIEQHQGQVGVDSAPGEGSTFWFTLPLVVQEQNS